MCVCFLVLLLPCLQRRRVRRERGPMLFEDRLRFVMHVGLHDDEQAWG